MPYESAPCPANLGDAWSFLAEGQVDEAYDAFDCLREALPEDGLPRVGFAISAALVAEHEAAVEAMRDALRVDPESLHYVPGDERLQVQFREMADLYQYQARRAYGDVDALFMVAVLSYLLDEPTGAHYAIDVGINLGDDDPSAHALRSMIETAMSESD